MLKVVDVPPDRARVDAIVIGMKRRTVASIAFTIAATVFSVVGVTGPARAAVTEFCSTPFAKAGYACFLSTGDKFKVSDNYADGLRSVVLWVTDYGRSGECHNANGAESGWVWCNYNFKEDRIVRFLVVARDGANGADQYPTWQVIAYTSGR